MNETLERTNHTPSPVQPITDPVQSASVKARMQELIGRLADQHSLTEEEYAYLIDHRDAESASSLAKQADRVRRSIYGNKVFTRGLIEISSICRNDCLYCGIRCSNKNAERYRLDPEVILACAKEGHELGFRTIVLQGGEDLSYSDDEICSIVAGIKELHPDCAVTLSIGERSRESYERYFEAGADRYLLRHETANEEHYRRLHPPELSMKNRQECLYTLKQIGYQVGAGFMVGSPYQTDACYADDFEFMMELQPEMIGIGPFIAHHDTPFRDMKAGTLEDTLFFLALLRLYFPEALLPATTALGTIHPLGREMGVKAGANVIMPNLSPTSVRRDYLLYDGKICTGDEAAECRRCMEMRMESIGYHVAATRGDHARFAENKSFTKNM